MKCMNRHSIRIGTDDARQSFPHIFCGIVREGQTEDISGIHIRFPKDVCDTGGKKLGFSASGSCDDHNRTINGIDGVFLQRVQTIIDGFEILVSHGEKMK
ncbi:MAG: hypothetical protein ACD_78C00349G0002 [uncultured bacterium (gcode 4)]|uniref:Uncharacterized protein n=1 Tax=uncultured bacterium (gcode 4) TaxID=1234023 RepID=K1YB54_9BACT|nr:MAG: hypothetical protein ACD_78C00349G0002 [uncultured bacterium (gcode 4)]